jgi:integrase/recombinase XerD
MLERYFLRPATVDRIRASWIAGAIEQYVAWLTDRGYGPRNIHRRVPSSGTLGTSLGRAARPRWSTCLSTSRRLWRRGSESGGASG